MTEDHTNKLQKAVSLLFIGGGTGQAAIGYELSKSASIAQQQVPANAASFALVTIIPGIIIAIGGLLQIASNHFTRLRRIEIETRIKRLELGLPCDDKSCPIQQIASRKSIPAVNVFSKPVVAKPGDDTVDVP